MFGKKLSLDDILKAIDNLPDEDKDKVKAKIDDLYKAEDEREIDKIEEEKEPEDKDEKNDEIEEESDEIGKDVDDLEEETSENEEEKPDEKEEVPDEQPTEKEEPATDEKYNELVARIEKLEAAFKGFDRQPKKADDKIADKLSELNKKYS